MAAGLCHNHDDMNKSPFWTPGEVDFLNHFLLREDAPEHCMDVAMLDGYLAAVVSGPNLIMPSEMLLMASSSR